MIKKQKSASTKGRRTYARREGKRRERERLKLTSLGDHSTRLEGVVDTLDGVLLHGNEEARRELRVRSTGVEELRE